MRFSTTSCSGGLLLLGVVMLAGCQNADLLDRVNRLQLENQELANTVQQQEETLQTTREELQQLRAKWSEFEQGYSPDLREQLEASLQTADETRQAIEAQQRVASEVLAAMKETEDAARVLKERCEQYEKLAQAPVVELVALRGSLEKLSQQQQSLQSRLGVYTGEPLSSRLQRLEFDVQRLRSEISSLKLRVR